LSVQKRKQFWVDAPLQLQMLGYVLALVTASLLLVAFSVLRGLSQSSLDSHQVFHSLDWVRQTIRGPLIVSSCLSLLASGLLTLIWSHRFAGPLRVLSSAMTRLRQGNATTPPRVRDTDTLQETIREFAEMQDDLRKLLAEDRHKAEAAAKRVEALAHKVDGEDRRELHAAAGEIKALLKRFHL
jgi:methyl-accepting chemotaxis protein